MMNTTPLSPTEPRIRAAGRDDINPSMPWRPEATAQPQALTVAEFAECRCPDLCDRDHGNE